MKNHPMLIVLAVSFVAVALFPAPMVPSSPGEGTALAARKDPGPPSFSGGRGGFPFLSQGEKRKNPPQPREAEGFVRHLYKGFLGREPRSDEAASWRDRLFHGDDRGEVVRDFLQSDEAFVRQLYLGLLNREPDPDGTYYFTDALRSGRTRQDVIDAIVGSQEFNQKVR